MTLGSIIRRAIDNKYLIVLKTKAKTVIAVPLEGEELGDEIEIPKRYITECTIGSLIISTKEMDKIIDGNARMIVHKAIKSWCAVVDENPEIVKLYDNHQRFVYYSNSVYERIIRKRLVMKSIKKDERDIIEIIPSVRIKFGSMIYAEWDQD